MRALVSMLLLIPDYRTKFLRCYRKAYRVKLCICPELCVHAERHAQVPLMILILSRGMGSTPPCGWTGCAAGPRIFVAFRMAFDVICF